MFFIVTLKIYPTKEMLKKLIYNNKHRYKLNKLRIRNEIN